MLRDKFAGALDVELERKKEIYIQLSRSATMRDLVYWLQIFMAVGITTLGLVLNSPAVIIGAMLISPLMNPILSAGLAFATGDLVLGFRAFCNLFFSSLLAIGLAFFLVALLPFKEMTSEIASRTAPNTLDLGVALFAGTVGAVATCRAVKGAVTSIPGVAIAVALMPPLCVVGYGIGLALSLNYDEGLRIARGGGLLYLTNLVAITFMAMIVFVLLRIDTSKVREVINTWRENDRESRWWLRQIDKIPGLEKAREIRSFPLRTSMILLPLLLIFMPLSESFSELKKEYFQKQKENLIEQKAKDLWEDFYANRNDGSVRSYLDELKIEEKDEKLNVYMRVFDNAPYTPGEKNEYKRLLASHLDRPADSISLYLVEVPTSARDVVNKPIDKPLPPTLAQLQTNFLQNLETAMTGLQLPVHSFLVDYRIIQSPNDHSILQIFYLSGRDIDPDAQNLIAAQVQKSLNLPHLRSELHRVPLESFPIEFQNGNPILKVEDIAPWENTAAFLHQHPRLRLEIGLLPEEDEKILAQKQQAIKEFFVQNRTIAADRLIFKEADRNFFNLVLAE